MAIPAAAPPERPPPGSFIDLVPFALSRHVPLFEVPLTGVALLEADSLPVDDVEVVELAEDALVAPVFVSVSFTIAVLAVLGTEAVDGSEECWRLPPGKQVKREALANAREAMFES